MRRVARVLAASCVAVLMLVAGCGTGGGSGDGEYSFVSPGGKTRLFYPPDERGRLTGLNGESLLNPGEKIRLSDFRGQPVVLNVWGSWCGPCRSEIDDLKAVQSRLGDRVRVLGINVRDERSAASDFVRNHGVNYPSIYSPSGRALLALDGFPRSTVPATIVLDRQHRVAAVYLTEITRAGLLPKVRTIVQEPSGAK
ncbi:thiol-disulfide isomerase/thioredoxin [Saccharopolyspora lacisalsi]|uniref:Thiol-disulfide isomerase/thioredoxin n=1 Tax=Halosaccharopolyspora lacisalsi TaxID=1000566 RepID=A0A839E785_9PSEU|nr:TlpA disulfide reductase family protein [Halosaccharopolyspora lacisalsi]MBA8827151.1 thiol-disulfide isomerase/thioredoxin [Halosaccharopolyspora lacisalsi]